MAEGKTELTDEATSAESEQLLAQSDDPLFDIGGSFAGLVMRSAGKLDEATRALLLIAAQPLAHVETLVWKRRAVGLMPRCRADCTRRKR